MEYTEQELKDIEAGKTIHKPFGICQNVKSIVFRCTKCNFALSTCADCISSEGKLTDEFMQVHFGEGEKSTPFIKAGDCYNCHRLADRKRQVGNSIREPNKEERSKIGKLKAEK